MKQSHVYLWDAAVHNNNDLRFYEIDDSMRSDNFPGCIVGELDQ